MIRADELTRSKLTNLPNLLTYLRVLLVPVIVVLMVEPASARAMNWAFLLFFVASMTDLADGYLARRFDLGTSIGKLLDPLADKLLTSAVLIMLIPLDRAAAWLVFLILAREMTITGIRSIAASQGLIMKASRMGKNKMVAQTVALHFLLLTWAPAQGLLRWTGTLLLFVSLVLGYWAAFDYCVDFYKKASSLAPDSE